jgi:molybdopterin converting factor small subunit
VRYFAAFRDATGVPGETVDSIAPSLRELFDECAARHDGLHAERAALVAVNDTMSDWDAAFEDGDEVLFFPPVAGG